MRVLKWTCISVLICLVLPMAGSVIYAWPDGKDSYDYPSGWSLTLAPPLGAPVLVETSKIEPACEPMPIEKIVEASEDHRAIPLLTCPPTYQGWRRLGYTLRPFEPVLERWQRRWQAIINQPRAEARTLTAWERYTPWTLWAVPSAHTPSSGGIMVLGQYPTLAACEQARRDKETAQRRYIASIKPLMGQVPVPTHTYICTVQGDEAT